MNSLVPVKRKPLLDRVFSLSNIGSSVDEIGISRLDALVFGVSIINIVEPSALSLLIRATVWRT